ncbi:hypothetical protein ABT063_46745 [Streptomyces sp. NPDC002838]|uniref:hypothetical protein n=1 Tax=Streptomyces sp. NPDC002838 TaxID=3154436 RepID=UPI0033223CCE
MPQAFLQSGDFAEPLHPLGFQGAVVQGGGPFGDVVHENVPDRAVGDGMAVNQLGRGELTAGLGLPQCR